MRYTLEEPLGYIRASRRFPPFPPPGARAAVYAAACPRAGWRPRKETPMDVRREAASHDHPDDRLGLHEPISRRDFLNGTLVAGAGLLLHGQAPAAPPPGDDWNGYGGVGDYRRSNGNTWEVMTA